MSRASRSLGKMATGTIGGQSRAATIANAQRLFLPGTTFPTPSGEGLVTVSLPSQVLTIGTTAPGAWGLTFFPGDTVSTTTDPAVEFVSSVIPVPDTYTVVSTSVEFTFEAGIAEEVEWGIIRLLSPDFDMPSTAEFQGTATAGLPYLALRGTPTPPGVLAYYAIGIQHTPANFDQAMGIEWSLSFTGPE